MDVGWMIQPAVHGSLELGTRDSHLKAVVSNQRKKSLKGQETGSMCLQDDGAVTTLVVVVPCRGLPGIVPQLLQAWSSWCCRVLLMCLLVAGGRAPAEFHSITLQHQCPFSTGVACVIAVVSLLQHSEKCSTFLFIHVGAGNGVDRTPCLRSFSTTSASHGCHGGDPVWGAVWRAARRFA